MKRQLTWKQIIKLGKQEVLFRLEGLGIEFDIKEHYFRLCSLLYKAVKSVKGSVVSLAKKRIEKAKKAVEEATNIHEHLDAIFDVARAELDALRV